MKKQHLVEYAKLNKGGVLYLDIIAAAHMRKLIKRFMAGQINCETFYKLTETDKYKLIHYRG